MTKSTIVQALCMIVCAGLLQLCGAIELHILSATPTQLQVRYRLDAREQLLIADTTDRRITFILTSPRPLHPQAQVQPTRFLPAATRPFIPKLQSAASGYAGMLFEQWFILDPYHAQSCASEGLITFTLSTQEAAFFVLTKSTAIKGIIHVPGVTGLAKKASTASFASYPFSRGIRIEINKDGIYYITGRELAALGVPISTVSSKAYRLYEQGSELPLAITNAYRPHLEHDDTLFFFGEHLRAADSYFTQFSNSRMYWLCWEMAGVGARLAKASGARRVDGTIYRPGSDNPVTARDFMSVVHLEEDNDIRWLGDVFTPENIDDIPLSTTIIDNWYWGFAGYEVKTDFTLRLAAPSINPAAKARLRIAMTGLSSIKENPNDHALTILLNNSSPTALSSDGAVMRWDGQTPTVYETEWFPARYLVHGNNTLTFLRETAAIDLSALNWVQVEYLRSFRALDGVVDFHPHPEDTGRTIEFDLRGFTTPHVDIWDLSTARIIQDYAVEQTGKGDSVTISFQDSIGSEVRYWAQSTARRKKPHTLTLDTLAPRWNFGEGVDYVMVAPGDALDILKPLAEYYRSSGMTVALLDIADVYNGFAWGRGDPQAIRSLLAALAAAYPNRPPRYLLLGGDTSHDLDKQRNELNIIPTHLSRIPGWGPSSDDGYFGTVIGDDNFSDVCVGRFPSRSLQELQHLVDKTLRYLKQPLSGYWRDNLLMLGGVEEEFTEFNDQLMANTIGSSMQVQRMDAYVGSPFFRDDYDATRSIADGINAGAYLVNFNGHGGGLTWSDRNFFSYTDLPLLYNGQWSEGGKLPFVFSFTCLTGFFESVFYRSLGEEMVRTPRHGAIGFYGASAYTPQRGNLLMNKLMVDNALHGGPTTIGELIKRCETEMLVRYGADMLPLVRQYNLLGDPALPWRLAADTLKLSAQLNHKQDSLLIAGRCAPLNSGSVRVVVGDKNSSWYHHIVPLDSGSFALRVAIKSTASVSSGFVRAYAWNSTQELKGATFFSKNALAVHQPQLSQASVASGDSVHISCMIGGNDSSSEQLSIMCLYETGLSGAPFETPRSVFMRFEPTTNRWVSSSPIIIGPTASLNQYLKVKFRLLSQARSLESEVFEYALQGKADLVFTSDTLQIIAIGDSLALQLTVLNTGNLSVPSFTTTLSYRSAADTLAHFSATVGWPLAPAAITTLRIPLPELSAQMEAFAHCDPANVLPEVNDNNNTLTLPLNLGFAVLRQPSDTLTTPQRSFGASPRTPLVKPLKAFSFVNRLGAAPPLKTPSRFLPLRHDSTAALRLALSTHEPIDSLQCFFALRDTSLASIAIARFDTTLRRWRWHATALASGAGRYTFLSATSSALYAPAQFEDEQPPHIRVTVDGREMRFVDYAALNKPFTIFISDPSGIDPSTISVLLNRQALDSTLFSLTSIDSTLSGIVLTAYPRQRRSVDTLTIQAMDLAGNRAEKSVAYRAGERLAIKFLACHPNPFSARQDKGGSVVQPIRLAFLLTDVATHATLSIRTLSGRLVRTWELKDVIGYQEIIWDGLTQQGFRIGNGAYYVKLEVSNEYEKTSKILRIAKLEGY